MRKPVSFFAFWVPAAGYGWLLIMGGIQGCEPARSPVMVETVDTSYVQQLAALSDSVKPVSVQSSPMAQALGASTGMDYWHRPSKKQLRIWYNAMGKVCGLEEQKDGIMQDSVAFYENGQRLFTFTFTPQGIKEGPVRYYYPDGRVKTDGWYKANQPTGVWRYFNEQGKLLYSEEYISPGQKKGGAQ
ncbi:MAG TPA: hypothetical protein PKD90_08060 [Phnomibacter sp.]|nr:hypothetical protein [Phnomibacter sp.]